MEWEYADIRSDFLPGIVPPENWEKSLHIVVSDGEILGVDEAGPWRPLTDEEYRWLGIEELSQHFLGLLGNVPVFANEVDPDADEPEGFVFEKLWAFLGKTDEAVFHLIGRAKQIVEWHRDHHFCGRCGKPTGAASNDRSRKCEGCGAMFYPRLSPSIIVLVTRGEEILLAKNAQSKNNFYTTLAGFVEPGESIEEAVHREVYEEVGIQVKNLTYYSSQPWPFPNSLMLGFHAEYDSGELVLQADEIADARWFHYTEMPNRPAMVSISGWLINAYIEQLNGTG